MQIACPFNWTGFLTTAGCSFPASYWWEVRPHNHPGSEPPSPSCEHDDVLGTLYQEPGKTLHASHFLLATIPPAPCHYLHFTDDRWTQLVSEPHPNSGLPLPHTLSSPLHVTYFLYRVGRKGKGCQAFPLPDRAFLTLSLQPSCPLRRGKPSTLSFPKHKAKQPPAPPCFHFRHSLSELSDSIYLQVPRIFPPISPRGRFNLIPSLCHMKKQGRRGIGIPQGQARSWRGQDWSSEVSHFMAGL